MSQYQRGLVLALFIKQQYNMSFCHEHSNNNAILTLKILLNRKERPEKRNGSAIDVGMPRINKFSS